MRSTVVRLKTTPCRGLRCTGFVLARTRLKLARCAENQILLSSVTLVLSEVEVFRRLIE